MTPFRTFPRLEGCDSFQRGHTVHYIQARLSGIRPGEAARILAVTDDGWIDIETPFDVQRRWTHDAGRLRNLVETEGPVCELRRVGVLAWPLRRSGEGPLDHAVSVAEEPSPCEAAAAPLADDDSPLTTEDLVAQLETLGGFVVAADRLHPRRPGGIGR